MNKSCSRTAGIFVALRIMGKLAIGHCNFASFAGEHPKNVVMSERTVKMCNFAVGHQAHYYIISGPEGERKF